MATAHLIHGFIGSGKTTFAKALVETEANCIRFTHDEWIHRLYGARPPAEQFQDLYERVDSLIWDTALDVLNNNCSVVLDSGFWSLASRQHALTQIESNGYSAQFYAIQCDLETMKSRTLSRSKKPPRDSLWIDVAAFEKLFEQFEPMDSSEDVILINGEVDPKRELSRI